MSDFDDKIKMYEAKSDDQDGLSEYEYGIYEDAIDQYNIYVDEINELHEKQGLDITYGNFSFIKSYIFNNEIHGCSQ